MASKKTKNFRRKPLQSRSRETVDAILEATAQILTRQGYAGCSTNQIAEKAGVSIGGLYQYFPDKDSILRELSIRVMRKDAEAIEACLKAMGDAPLERLTPELIRVALERHAEQPRLRLVLQHEVPIGRPEQDLRPIRQHLASLLTEYLRKQPHVETHDDLELDILILVNAVDAAICAAIQEYGAKLDRERLIASVSQLVFGYLQPSVGGVNPVVKPFTPVKGA